MREEREKGKRMKMARFAFREHKQITVTKFNKEINMCALWPGPLVCCATFKIQIDLQILKARCRLKYLL